MSQGQVALGNSPVADVYAEELAAGELEVPLLPEVATEVLSSTLDDKVTAARLAELIQQDQALAAHLLRVVNAPAFRGSVQIVALQQAIARLGMERIREIALTISLKGTLVTPDLTASSSSKPGVTVCALACGLKKLQERRAKTWNLPTCAGCCITSVPLLSLAGSAH